MSHRREEGGAAASRRGVVRLVVVAAALASLGADGCEEAPRPPPPPPGPALGTVARNWRFSTMELPGGEAPLGPERSQVGGVVDEVLELGALLFIPPGELDALATAEVFANEDGSTYAVRAEAPHTTPPDGSGIAKGLGSAVQLHQYQLFRKTRPDARLTAVVTRAVLEAIDGNPGPPSTYECPWHQEGASYLDCMGVMGARVFFSIEAFDYRDQRTFFETGGFAELEGWAGVFDLQAYTDRGATRPLWTERSFTMDYVGGPGSASHARAVLLEPIALEVPLDEIAVGEVFALNAFAKASTMNLRQRESYLAAAFRDPAELEGLALEHEGLQPLETPLDAPALPPPPPVAACPGAPDPAAGVVAFEAGAFVAPELPGMGAVLLVTRSGGGAGEVSARVTRTGGTAGEGTDHLPLPLEVRFADGEEGTRAVELPLVLDAIAEPDETVELALEVGGGCAGLGELDAAVLTVQDDDRPPALPPTFLVGGSVTGLAGSGLVLREVITGFEVRPAADGPFTFGAAFSEGDAYEVRVATPPSAPLQVCTVTNGAGTVGAADVTDLLVTCETPPANGALDPTFADAGRQTAGLPGGAAALALLADGRIVVAGGRSVARYGADGAPDPSFGGDGTVQLTFSGIGDRLRGAAAQADGKVIVVGQSRIGGNDDFVVARLLEDGSLDPGFGVGGWTSTDFAGSVDRAYAVQVAGDGGVFVVGHAGTAFPGGVDNDFAVARYTAAGVLDPAFGGDGRATLDVAGLADLAYAAVITGDGGVVVGGRAGLTGTDAPDLGLVKWRADGLLDPAFGPGGVVVRDATGVGGWDEIADLALYPDGRIAAAILVERDHSFAFAGMRFGPEGVPDPTFGTEGGIGFVEFSAFPESARAVTVDAEGRMILAGEAAGETPPDFGLARLTLEGDLDPTFGDGGKVRVDFFGNQDGAEAVELQADGKVVVAGSARAPSSTELGLVRVLP